MLESKGTNSHQNRIGFLQFRGDSVGVQLFELPYAVRRQRVENFFVNSGVSLRRLTKIIVKLIGNRIGHVDSLRIFQMNSQHHSEEAKIIDDEEKEKKRIRRFYSNKRLRQDEQNLPTFTC